MINQAVIHGQNVFRPRLCSGYWPALPLLLMLGVLFPVFLLLFLARIRALSDPAGAGPGPDPPPDPLPQNRTSARIPRAPPY